MGYSPWGHKESDMTEQLSLHMGRDHLPPWSAGMEPDAKQIQGPVGFPEASHLPPTPPIHTDIVSWQQFFYLNIQRTN